MTSESLSEYIFKEVRCLVDSKDSLDRRQEAQEQLHDASAHLDAYLSMSGHAQCHLPSIDFRTLLRKAYTLLVWVRPRVDMESVVEKAPEDDHQSPTSRIIYRFSTTHDDTRATGICVTADKWKIDDEGFVHTVLTAYSLSPKAQSYATFCQVPVALKHNQWQLIGFSHSFPYLKRPFWSVTVDGQLVGQGELNYPVPDSTMEHNLLFSHATASAERPDDQTAAIGSNKSKEKVQYKFTMDLVSVGLYSDLVSPTLQALLKHAGPQVTLQSHRVIPSLPPVPNWTKGSSMDGPKVGIPLCVHSNALDLQQLWSKCILSFTAMDARPLGTDRMIVNMKLVSGMSDGTPRVGLVQPGNVIRVEPDDLPSLYLTGKGLSLFHSLSHALLILDADVGDVKYYQHFSVLWQEQHGLTACVLPFFLALPPPGQLLKMHKDQAKRAFLQVYHLFSRDASFAAGLIRLLASSIRHGGARCHEEVLQDGLLHVLASSLRLSLLRAQKHRLFKRKDMTVEEWMQRPMDESVLSQKRQEGSAPTLVPVAVVDACVDLIDACCGPEAASIEELESPERITRTSDISLTCLFGVGLDFDLWGGDATAARQIYRAVASRYGGTCPTFGYILRSQVSAQYFLDCIRIRYDANASATGEDVMQASLELARLLQSLLLSSLSNKRSISQGEHDIAACVSALSDCPLGSVCAHVVITAIIGVLSICEIMPVEVSLLVSPTRNDEEFMMHVASRLGRNLLVSNFHDVVAPMLLTRTIHSDERALVASSSVEEVAGDPLSWKNHWRLCLLLFSWVASVAGVEGHAVAVSSGKLALTSALAGSLSGALDGAEKALVSALFHPPPAMALMIGSTIRDEWSYTDLISDRLQIMLPFVASMIVALLSYPTDQHVADIQHATVEILVGLLTSLGGSFHRVFGGVIHSTGGERQRSANRQLMSQTVKAARTYVPSLLTASILLERHISLRDTSQIASPVVILKPQSSNDELRRTDMESWIDVTSESVVSEVTIDVPSEECYNRSTLVETLRVCQRSILNTAAGLIANSMKLGGSGSSAPLWQNILSTLADTVSSLSRESIGRDTIQMSKSNDALESTIDGRNMLCRLVCLVVTKCLKRDYEWETWSYELSSAVSSLCVLVEEKGLLDGTSEDDLSLSTEQVALIGALLALLEYGRDTTGWCQLTLPTMANKDSSPGVVSASEDLSQTSKLMLPALRPAFRILAACLPRVASTIQVAVYKHNESNSSSSPLLALLLLEFDETLTAAIVGLSFSAARDMAMQALASLRRAVDRMNEEFDTDGAQKCQKLARKVVKELHERYRDERRLRDTALFDAYADDGNDSAKRAAAESNEVERLILGGGVAEVENESEEICFGDTPTPKKPSQNVSEDFVLFHEPSSLVEDNKLSLGYAQYEGLGSSLDQCVGSDDDVDFETAMAHLSSFLDAFDNVNAQDSADIVELFQSQMDLSESKPSRERARSAGSVEASAVDSMSAFFELATGEKARVKDIQVRHLPGQRYSRCSFAERFCWEKYTEILPGTAGNLWERCVTDGNRDIRSRIPSQPVAPQFPQHIPKYLDNGTGDSEPEHAETPNGTANVTSPSRDGSSSMNNLDALLRAGNLEVVDITKKEVEDDGQPDIILPDGADGYDDDFFNEGTGAETDTAQSSQEGDTDSEMEKTTQDIGIVEEQSREMEEEESAALISELVGKGTTHTITSSAFATPPDNASSSLSLVHSAAASLIEMHLTNCLHIKAEGSRQCTMLLTDSHLILEYDGDPDGFFEGEILSAQEEADRQKLAEDAMSGEARSEEDQVQQKIDRRHRETAALRPKSIRWNLSEISHVYLRRYRLRDSSIELFFIPSGGTSFGGFGAFSPSCSVFLDFGPGQEGLTRRDDAAVAIMKRCPPQTLKQWPDRNMQFVHDQLSRLTIGWHEGRVSNFDYLLHLNMLAGRSFNDICQYPVFPWILADYESEGIPDLSDPKSFRDLTKPVGALNEDRLNDFLERFKTFADPTIPPFMYGSHYSTSAGVVLHFLIRLHPFAGLHRQLQSGHFDVADRLFSSVPRTWRMVTGTSAAEVKELTPEWYCNPSFLRNINRLKLGTSQDGELLGDVKLPPWAKESPERFIEVMRAALETPIASEGLPDWIDLVFGFKQQGKAAVEANNVFFYLTYYGSVDVTKIEDDGLREAMELQIAHFGQCPMQVFKRPHIRRLARGMHSPTFFQTFSAYNQRLEADDSSDQPRMSNSIYGDMYYLPFATAPLSHWVHLDAPPPGPHASLLTVRLAGVDRCLAIDAKGIFHTFRWAWRPDEPDGSSLRSYFDRGCFVAQRELPRFKVLPRLMYVPENEEYPVLAISKTLFAGRSVMLVLSAGDAFGGLAMQLVDPAKGSIRGEVLVTSAHSARITCIVSDPIGTAAGHGGVGGELAVIGSEDGSASVWRFMSSHYLPLRPRVRLFGHEGSAILAAALASSIHLVATVSKDRCCLHHVGNGSILRSFTPRSDGLAEMTNDRVVTSSFSSAIAISVQGFIVTVTDTVLERRGKIVTLDLWTVEGLLVGNKPLESWRGSPSKVECTPDGTTVWVCSGRGITFHRVSVIHPLDLLDEWHITEDLTNESVPRAFDMDLGPSINRPVVAAAACSEGVLRLHALTGITHWSEKHRKSGLMIGNAFKPTGRLNQAVKKGWGQLGQLAGVGRDIGREVKSDVKQGGMTGLFNNLMKKGGK